MTTTTSSAPSTPPRPTDLGTRPPRWTGRSARQAWIIGGSIVTVVMLLFSLLQVLSWLAQETTTVETVLTADQLAGVQVVEVRNDRGQVTVVGTADDQVRISSEVSRGLIAPTNGWHIDGDRLVVSSHCPPLLNDRCRVRHDIEIPAELGLVLDVEIGGARVSDVDGGADVTTEHGDLELVRVGGALRGDTAHGSLRGVQLTASTAAITSDHGDVSLEFATTPDRIVVDSDFGDVDLSFPDEPDAVFAVSLTTEFGRATNALRTDPTSSATVDVRSGFGRVTLGYTP